MADIRSVVSPTSIYRTFNAGKSEISLDMAEHMMVIPPDGGWGWIIVFTAFIVNFVVDGVMYGFGLFLDEISVDLKTSPTRVAIVNSVMTGCMYGMGPIVGAVINRYGFRIVGILGGLITAGAFVVATYLDDILFFVILLGVFAGLGTSMLYVDAVIAVGFYFARWRALAMAAAASGSAVSIISFPPIMKKLFEQYTWKIKFKIIAGMFGFCSLCTIMWKPIPPSTIDMEDKRIKFGDKVSVEVSPSLSNGDSEAQLLTIYRFFRRFQEIIFPTVAEEGKSIVTFYLREDNPGSVSGFGYFPHRHSTASGAVSRSYGVEMNDSKCARCCRSCFGNCCGSCCGYCALCCNRCARICDGCASRCGATYNRPLYRDDVFFAGSIYAHYPTVSQRSSAGPHSKRPPLSYHKSVTRVATVMDLMESTTCKCCPEAVVRGLASMLNCTLLKSIGFDILLISGMLTMMGMYPPYMFVIQRAEVMGVDSNWSILLLSLIGVANIVGRILCGFVSFIPKVDALTVSYFTTTVCGLAIIISCYTPSLAGQVTFVILFGSNIASLIVLRPIVIVDLFGLEHLTNGFGLIVLLEGLGCLTGVPLAGILHDLTGTFDATFLFSGCSILLSGILLIPIRAIVKREQKKQKNQRHVHL